MTSACTIIAGNYLVSARVLVDSFFAHHPQGSFTVLVVDDEDRRLAMNDARVDWRRLGDIGLDTAEIHRLAGIYDVTELSTAVKPRLLQCLLDEGRSEVIYLDPDIYIYDSLADIVLLAAQHGIVLTPHTTVPFPDDGRQVDALFVLAAGVYNLGFIAVGSSAGPFLDWWWRQTRRRALNDVTRMMFTDQRWVDYVPSLFGHYLLRDPGYNVAYWNLHARTIAMADGWYVVECVPLRFFHFSGFDPRKPWLLSRHQGDRPRILLSEHPALARICHEYGARLAEAGVDAASEPERAYGWSLAAAGFELTSRMRRLYWRGVMEAERGEGPEPPDPFDRENPDRFVAWLNAPDQYGPRHCSRFAYAIYCARHELQAHFPDIGGADEARFADWLWRYGIEQESIPLELLPAREGDHAAAAPATGTPAALEPGLNIAGYFRSEFGIGEAGRLAIRAVEAAGIPYATVTQHATFNPERHPFKERAIAAGTRPFDINLLCVNADATLAFAHEAGPSFFDGRHTIGYWFWEVAPLPHSMHGAFERVDEVWAATDYVADILRAAGRKPVFTVPLPLLVPVPTVPPAITRERLGLPERFTFLLLFDFLSVVERKNPLGLIEAFTRAFAPGEGPLLVLKSINGHLLLPQLERLRATVAARPDILSLDGHYSADEKNGLLAACDCYVSLHRAEGLGLTMAEAMALGKPTIATAYSGNLHFMTDENSYLVDYTLSAVPAGCEPYAVGSRWAEPDLGHAARLMREVYEHPREAAQRGERGRLDILERHGVGVSAAAIAERIESIRRARTSVDVVLPELTDATDMLDVTDVAAADVAQEPPVEEIASSPAVVAALDALVPHLELLARPRLGVEGRPWPTMRGAVQRSLFRLIKPYWFQQRQFQDALIDALRSSVKVLAADVTAANASALAGQQQAQARIDEVASALTRGQAEMQAAMQAETQASLARLQERLAALSLAHDGSRIVQRSIDGGTPVGYGRTNGTNGNAHAHGNGNGHHVAAVAAVAAAPEPLFRTRQRLYLPWLAQRAPVLDVGCGYGRMLDLLRAAKLPAFGIDADPHMVSYCRAHGHLVEEADALPFLRARSSVNGSGNGDGSLGAIFNAEVNDHLALEPFEELLHLCRRRLEPGGVLIAERSMSGEFADLHPEIVLALCQRAGFEAAHVLFHPTASGSARERESQGRFAVVATAGSR